MSNFDKYEKDGRLYKRVTSVQGLLAKPQLVPWAVRLAVDFVRDEWNSTTLEDFDKHCGDILNGASKEHKRVLEHSGDVGSQIHQLIANRIPILFSSEDVERFKQEVDFGYKSYLKWARDFQAVPLVKSSKKDLTAQSNSKEFAKQQQEVIVYSDKHGYAGTVDWIGELLVPESSKKKLYIVDFKTGNSLYPEQHVMQLTAYEQAYWETFGKHIPNLMNVRLFKDKVDYEWREYTKEEKEIGWEGFKALLQLSDSLDAWKELKKKNRKKKK